MIRLIVCLLFAVVALVGCLAGESQAAVVIGRNALVVRQPRAVVVRQPLFVRQPQAFVVAPQQVLFQPQQVIVPPAVVAPQTYLQPLVSPSGFFLQPSLGITSGCGALLIR